MRCTLCRAALALICATSAAAAEFGARGGPEPANVDAVMEVLRQDPYDLELLISFGTSKGGSAGHLALAIRDNATSEESVYSANFYADRAPKHAKGFYTADLLTVVPKAEYLYKTSSSLGDTASFGLDYGEIYKRSVIGIRVYGVPPSEKRDLVAYFGRINDDYRNGAKDTEYHDGEIVYGYLDLNCAKAIGVGFKYGAGYQDLEINSVRRPHLRKLKAALSANVPTEMAMKLLEQWSSRGYGLDVVYYKKYAASTYVDPHDDEPMAFKDLPDRFPSVLSRDFRSDQGEYKDFDNLFAMYVLYNLGKYRVRVNRDTLLLEIDKLKLPMVYADAARRATEDAESDSRTLFRRLPTPPNGSTLWGSNANDTAVRNK